MNTQQANQINQIDQSSLIPLSCFLGHVDVGKTSLLDALRNTSVQKNEVGGITQQIGATFFNKNTLINLSEGLSLSLDINGLLIVDTPGHDCFTQMRLTGMKVSHFPVLIIDINVGVEKQTRQCMELMTKLNIDYIIVLNKVDKIFGWKSSKDDGKNLKKVLSRQKKDVLIEFKNKVNAIICQIAECGLNCALYYENLSPKDTINMVPLSAKTGDGIPDLILLISKLTTKIFKKKITEDPLYKLTHGYMMETRFDETHGLINYTLQVSGSLNCDDVILVETIDGTIIEGKIKRLCKPPDQIEMKHKVNFKLVTNVLGTLGFAIKFHNNTLSDIIAPGGLFVKLEDSAPENITIIRELMCNHMKLYEDCATNEDTKLDEYGIILNVPSKGMGTAIVNFVRDTSYKTDKTGLSKPIKIKDIHVGKIDKTTIIRATTNKLEINLRATKSLDYLNVLINGRYNVILDYDASYTDSNISYISSNMSSNQSNQLNQSNAQNTLISTQNILNKKNDIYSDEIIDFANKSGVKIFSGNMIHSLINSYNNYVMELNEKIKTMYPNIQRNQTLLKILPKYIFLKGSPLLFGVNIVSGELRKGMIVTATYTTMQSEKKSKKTKMIILGSITGIQKDNKDVDLAVKKDNVCIKIEKDEHIINMTGDSIEYVYAKDFNEEWTLSNWMSMDDLKLLEQYPEIFI